MSDTPNVGSGKRLQRRNPGHLVADMVADTEAASEQAPEAEGSNFLISTIGISSPVVHRCS
jgi:hypothetical protein